MDASTLLDRSAQLIEGVAASSAWAEVMLASGLFLMLCLWFIMIGTGRD